MVDSIEARQRKLFDGLSRTLSFECVAAAHCSQSSMQYPAIPPHI